MQLKISLFRLLTIIFILTLNVNTFAEENWDPSVLGVVDDGKVESISDGNKAFLTGDFAKAIKYYEEGLKQNRSVAFYNMGVSYYMLHNVKAAEESFKAAIDEDPSFIEAIMNLVAVLAEQEKSVEAEEYISKIVNKQQGAKVFVDMANLSLKNGKPAKAAFYYQKAMEMDEYSEYIALNYANFLISIGEIDAGEELLNSIVSKDFIVWYNLAYVAWMKGRYDDAYEYAKIAGTMADGTVEGNNKLAKLFVLMKKYDDEAEILIKMINWDPEKDYRIRLVKSYLHSWKIDEAIDEAEMLLNDYPDDVDVIIVNYDVRIASGLITEADRLIREKYSENKNNDLLFYYLIRHICLHERKMEEASKYLNTPKQTPLVNLARVAYYVSKLELNKAEQLMNIIPEDTLNDYYVYKTFLLFKDKQYREAERVLMNVNPNKPEYFWYSFAIAWNLKNVERINELLLLYKNDLIISTRIPVVKYNLIPSTYDMSFTFKFDGRGPDIAATLLYPFFIEPDEVYPFIVLGYKLLKDSEEQAALSELIRSIDYSKAVKINNDGVINLLTYDYNGAYKYFKEAEKTLKNDTFIKYNIGLSLFLNGDVDGALEYFKASAEINRYFAPAHFGMGICKEHYGFKEEANAHYRDTINYADEYLGLNNSIILPMIVNAKYLANIALEHPVELLADYENEPNKNNFIEGMASVARYMQINDLKELEQLMAKPFYRSEGLYYLLHLFNTPLSLYKEEPSSDRNTVMAAKYITAVRKKSVSEEFLGLYLNDKKVLIDLINLSTLIQNKALGLKYLRSLSKTDYSYPLQYKSSLYYFMWLGDFINAEASYTTLNRLGYNDKDVEYYMVLYFLLNYNQTRLNEALEQYIEKYPSDYKGKVVATVKLINEGDISFFMSELALLLLSEPFIFDKISLEMDIERF